ncbi:unnamed protein product, partial [Prorocentrum cordatum]
VRALPAEQLARCWLELAAAPGLNPSQREAIEAAFTRRCTLVQGPPGTGKTTTAVHVLKAWVGLGVNRCSRPPRAMPLDNIAEGLAKLGVKVVRVGRPERIRGDLERLTMDAQLKERRARAEAAQRARDEADRASAHHSRLQHLEAMPVAAVRREAEQLGVDLSLPALAHREEAPPEALAAPPPDAGGGAEEATGQRPAASPDSAAAGAEEATAQRAPTALDAVLGAIAAAQEARQGAEEAKARAAKSPEAREADDRASRRRLREQEQEFQMEVLGDADVICTQMISAGSPLFLRLGEFQGILVDEVAQATEVSTIVPLVQRGCERLVLTGDHSSCPPRCSPGRRRGAG